MSKDMRCSEEINRFQARMNQFILLAESNLHITHKNDSSHSTLCKPI